jgi:uncharacterized protein (TIGR03083 family)
VEEEAVAEPVIELLAAEWAALDALCSTLTAEEWALPTDCPGWTVQDQLAHLVGTESMLAGDPAPPDASGDEPAHVRNEIGRANEAWIASMRDLPPGEVLTRFRAITARRLDQLRAGGPELFEALGPSPVGRVPYREFMNVRVMDHWVHEQDIRRAAGRPGHRSGPVVEHSLARFEPAMAFVVGKKAAAPEGTSVRFELGGEAPRRIDVAVRDGRAVLAVPPDAGQAPTVTLRLDVETWWCLALGRRDGPSALAAGDVVLDGDIALGERIVDNLTFMI